MLSKDLPHFNETQTSRVWHRFGAKRPAAVGQSTPALPGISDVNLFRYQERIVDLDAEISHRAFDLCMSKQKLNGPEIASPPVN